MLKLKTAAVLFVFLLLLSITCVSSAIDPTFPVTVESPTEGAVYTSSEVILEISAVSNYPDEYIHSVTVIYCLDNQITGTISLTVTHETELVSNAIGEIVLTGLSQGSHKVSITGETSGGYYFTSETYSYSLTPVSVSFFVNLGVAPNMSVSGLSHYVTNSVALNITTDNSEVAVSYCLDGLENFTLPQDQTVVVSEGFQYNVALSGLSDGAHTLTAYATDSFNNTGTAMHSFTVDTATSTPTVVPQTFATNPPLAWIAGGAIAGTVIAAISLLLIYKKHKH